MIAPTSTRQRTLHAARNRQRLSIWSPMTTTLDCAFSKAELYPTGLPVCRPFGRGVPFHAVERRANDPFRGVCFVEQRIPDSCSEMSTPVRVGRVVDAEALAILSNPLGEPKQWGIERAAPMQRILRNKISLRCIAKGINGRPPCGGGELKTVRRQPGEQYIIDLPRIDGRGEPLRQIKTNGVVGL